MNLLLAAMDLKLVQLLRGAMNHGGPAAGMGAVHPQPRIEPRPVHHPDPRIEPRKVIEPTPRFEPRKVHHPEPRFEPAPQMPCPTYSKPKTKPVLPPPWMQQPVENPPEPRPVIKQVNFTTEVVHKGSLIDFFI